MPVYRIICAARGTRHSTNLLFHLIRPLDFPSRRRDLLSISPHPVWFQAASPWDLGAWWRARHKPRSRQRHSATRGLPCSLVPSMRPLLVSHGLRHTIHHVRGCGALALTDGSLAPHCFNGHRVRLLGQPSSVGGACSRRADSGSAGKPVVHPSTAHRAAHGSPVITRRRSSSCRRGGIRWHRPSWQYPASPARRPCQTAIRSRRRP